MMEYLEDAQIFTTLDPNCGYWQIPLRTEYLEKTAFVSHSGFYEYIGMPFGLTNAPVAFQSVIDIVLR